MTFAAQQIMNGIGGLKLASGAGLAQPQAGVARRVLIVEDDDNLRDALGHTLADEGWQVEPAGNGAQAMDMIDPANPPSIILLDLMMPVMNGWQFLEQREYRRGLAEIPVVVMSAHLDIPRHAAPHLPVAATIRKPIDIAQLLETLEAHRSRPTH